MAQTRDKRGATSVGGADEHKKRGLGWLWWLLLLAGLLALGIFLLLRNAGDDGDDAGVDVSDEQSAGANEDADTGEGLGDTADEATDGGDGTSGDGSSGSEADGSGGDCPSSAGQGGEDETGEIGSAPGEFDGCRVAVTGTVLESAGQSIIQVQGPQGTDPVTIVLTSEADSAGSDFEGQPVVVEGTARAELDPAAAAESFDLDEQTLQSYAGQPYVEASSVELSP